MTAKMRFLDLTISSAYKHFLHSEKNIYHSNKVHKCSEESKSKDIAI